MPKNEGKRFDQITPLGYNCDPSLSYAGIGIDYVKKRD
jgi:hypothetical protein